MFNKKMVNESSTATLGYWKIRGLAEPVRNILYFTKTKFNDKQYSDKVSWAADKESLASQGMPFANLPYYTDNNVKLVQSTAILKYIGELHNLNGSTPSERATIDMLMFELVDQRTSFTRMCYNEKFQDLVPGYLVSLMDFLKEQSAWLSDKSFIAGESISTADFVFYEVLCQNVELKAGCLDSFENLKNYKLRFEKLDGIKEYLESGSVPGAFNGFTAMFSPMKI